MYHRELIVQKAESHGVKADFLIQKVKALPYEPRSDLEMYVLLDQIIADGFEYEFEALYDGQDEDPEHAFYFAYAKVDRS